MQSTPAQTREEIFTNLQVPNDRPFLLYNSWYPTVFFIPNLFIEDLVPQRGVADRVVISVFR